MIINRYCDVVFETGRHFYLYTDEWVNGDKMLPLFVMFFCTRGYWGISTQLEPGDLLDYP